MKVPPPPKPRRMKSGGKVQKYRAGGSVPAYPSGGTIRRLGKLIAKGGKKLDDLLEEYTALRKMENRAPTKEMYARYADDDAFDVKETLDFLDENIPTVIDRLPSHLRNAAYKKFGQIGTNYGGPRPPMTIEEAAEFGFKHNLDKRKPVMYGPYSGNTGPVPSVFDTPVGREDKLTAIQKFLFDDGPPPAKMSGPAKRVQEDINAYYRQKGQEDLFPFLPKKQGGGPVYGPRTHGSSATSPGSWNFFNQPTNWQPWQTDSWGAMSSPGWDPFAGLFQNMFSDNPAPGVENILKLSGRAMGYSPDAMDDMMSKLKGINMAGKAFNPVMEMWNNPGKAKVELPRGVEQNQGFYQMGGAVQFMGNPEDREMRRMSKRRLLPERPSYGGYLETTGREHSLDAYQDYSQDPWKGQDSWKGELWRYYHGLDDKGKRKFDRRQARLKKRQAGPGMLDDVYQYPYGGSVFGQYSMNKAPSAYLESGKKRGPQGQEMLGEIEVDLSQQAPTMSQAETEEHDTPNKYAFMSSETNPYRIDPRTMQLGGEIPTSPKSMRTDTGTMANLRGPNEFDFSGMIANREIQPLPEMRERQVNPLTSEFFRQLEIAHAFQHPESGVERLPYDSRWEYKRDGRQWKAREIGNKNWITAKGSALAAIRQAFGDNLTQTDKKSIVKQTAAQSPFTTDELVKVLGDYPNDPEGQGLWEARAQQISFTPPVADPFMYDTSTYTEESPTPMSRAQVAQNNYLADVAARNNTVFAQEYANSLRTMATPRGMRQIVEGTAEPDTSDNSYGKVTWNSPTQRQAPTPPPEGVFLRMMDRLNMDASGAPLDSMRWQMQQLAPSVRSADLTVTPPPSVLERQDGGDVGAGEQLQPIQAEKGELVLFQNGMISKAHAKKNHEQMVDNQITDILPPGSFIASKRPNMRLSRKEASRALVGVTPIMYEEGSAGRPPKEITMASIMPKPNMTMAKYGARIQSKFPMTDRMDDAFSKLAVEENKLSRLPYIEGMRYFTEKKKREQGIQDTPTMRYGGNVPKYQRGGGIAGAIAELIKVGAGIGIGAKQKKKARQRFERNQASIANAYAEQQGYLTQGTGLGAAGQVLASLQNPQVDAPSLRRSVSSLEAMDDQINPAVRQNAYSQINRSAAALPLAIQRMDPRQYSYTNEGQANQLYAIGDTAANFAQQDTALRNQKLGTLANIYSTQDQARTNARNKTRQNLNALRGGLFSNLGTLGTNYFNQRGALSASNLQSNLQNEANLANEELAASGNQMTALASVNPMAFTNLYNELRPTPTVGSGNSGVGLNINSPGMQGIGNPGNFNMNPWASTNRPWWMGPN